MRVTTYYSYKGGLGRSLLVAWSAQALASQGGSVVALDLDLEAPGLAFKLGFGRDDELGPGVVGLLSSFQRGAPPPDSLGAWLRPVPNAEKLWLLPAGPLASTDYWRQLASLSWEQLFFGPDPQGVRFFHWLREAIEREHQPDHLLIDARTGVTEMGGAALTLMADQILALVGTSEEGLHGTREALRAVVRSARAAGRSSPRIGLILARMPASLATPDLQRLRKAVRDSIRAEADPLTATVDVPLPLVVRSEPMLQTDECEALGTRDLRVHEDYRTVLSWIEGGDVPQDPPGIALPQDASLEELRNSIAVQRQLAERQPEHYLPDVASSLENLGVALANQGLLEQATLSVNEAVRIRRRLATERPEAFERDLARALTNLSAHLLGLGRLGEAIQAAQEAVWLYGRLAKTHLEAFVPDLSRALGNLGYAYAASGEVHNAIAHFEQALALDRQVDDRSREAIALGNLGNAYLRLGEVQKAIEYYEQALVIGRGIGDLRCEGTALGSLGVAHAELNDAREAIEYFEQALVVDRQLGDPGGVVGVLGSLGNAYLGLEEPQKAIEYYDQALAISRENGDRRLEGSALGSLGLAYAKLGDVPEAIEYYERALLNCREIGNRRGEGTVLANLGAAHKTQGNLAEATRLLEQAKAIGEEIGDEHIVRIATNAKVGVAAPDD